VFEGGELCRGFSDDMRRHLTNEIAAKFNGKVYRVSLCRGLLSQMS